MVKRVGGRRPAVAAKSSGVIRKAKAAQAAVSSTEQSTEHRVVNLALQGGGAHGAFTWGVLDRLLEDGRVKFEGAAATSAGAMNAAVLAYGLTIGGPDGARDALLNFWRRISHAASQGPLQPTPFDRMMNNRSLEGSPFFMYLDLMTRLMSPYQFNPTNFNPLRKVLEASVDFDAIHSGNCPIKVFLCATNVRSGKIKVFRNKEISVDSVLASACLPFMFQAVEIDGEAYWDGGYMGNPPLYPLIYHCDSTDVLIIHINPLRREEVPRSATDILNRINEISFNSSLMREMRAIAFVTKLIEQNAVHDVNLKKMNVHGISDDAVMTELGATSKLNADWDFLLFLRDAGRAAAERWLTANFQRIGKESTIDIHETYL